MLQSNAKIVLIRIDDAVLRLDVESAFTGSGYLIIEPERGDPLPADLTIDLAVIDTDGSPDAVRRLIESVAARGVPCVLLTNGDSDGTVPAYPPGIGIMTKPLASDRLLSRAAGMVSRPQ